MNEWVGLREVLDAIDDVSGDQEECRIGLHDWYPALRERILALDRRKAGKEKEWQRRNRTR